MSIRTLLIDKNATYLDLKVNTVSANNITTTNSVILAKKTQSEINLLPNVEASILYNDDTNTVFFNNGVQYSAIDGGAGTVVHNNTTSKQGGDGLTEFFHIDQNDFNDISSNTQLLQLKTTGNPTFNSITSGGNSLGSTEFSNLTGQNQPIKTSSTPTFGNVTSNTGFTIGANTLTTSEFGFLDGQDQSIKIISTPTFGNVTVNTGFTIGANTLTTTEFVFLDGQDQAIKTTSDPLFNSVSVANGKIASCPVDIFCIKNKEDENVFEINNLQQAKVFQGNFGIPVPSDVLIHAPYSTDLDFTVSQDIATGTCSGGTCIVSGGIVQLSSSRILYTGTTNYGGTEQIGCIRIGFIPNFTSSPSSVTYIYTLGAGPLANSIMLYMNPANTNLRLRIVDSSGVNIFDGDVGFYNAIAGVFNDIELNYSLTAGQTRLFVDGAQVGSTLTNTGTRTFVTAVYIGSRWTGDLSASFGCSYFTLFNQIQHTSNYTPDSGQYDNSPVTGLSFQSTNGDKAGLMYSASGISSLKESSKPAVVYNTSSTIGGVANIFGTTEGYLETFSGVIIRSGTIEVDSVLEATSSNGTIINGVTCKNNDLLLLNNSDIIWDNNPNLNICGSASGITYDAPTATSHSFSINASTIARIDSSSLSINSISEFTPANGVAIQTLLLGASTARLQPTSSNTSLEIQGNGTGLLFINDGLKVLSEKLTDVSTNPSLETVTTYYVTTSSTGDYTPGLANGQNAQLKTILFIGKSGSDNVILSPITTLGFTSLTFDAVGESATLQYVSDSITGWVIISVNGATII